MEEEGLHRPCNCAICEGGDLEGHEEGMHRDCNCAACEPGEEIELHIDVDRKLSRRSKSEQRLDGLFAHLDDRIRALEMEELSKRVGMLEHQISRLRLSNLEGVRKGSSPTRDYNTIDVALASLARDATRRVSQLSSEPTRIEAQLEVLEVEIGGISDQLAEVKTGMEAMKQEILTAFRQIIGVVVA